MPPLMKPVWLETSVAVVDQAATAVLGSSSPLA